jgi:hypothetical protein
VFYAFSKFSKSDFTFCLNGLAVIVFHPTSCGCLRFTALHVLSLALFTLPTLSTVAIHWQVASRFQQNAKGRRLFVSTLELERSITRPMRFAWRMFGNAFPIIRGAMLLCR